MYQKVTQIFTYSWFTWEIIFCKTGQEFHFVSQNIKGRLKIVRFRKVRLDAVSRRCVQGVIIFDVWYVFPGNDAVADL